MESLNNILIEIELNEKDDSVCQFVDRLAKFTDFRSITLLHVTEDIELPKELTEKYPGLLPSVDESIKEAVQAQLERYERLKDHKNIRVEILSGKKLKTIPPFVRKNDIDLVVLGRNNNDRSESTYLKKLIRNLSCSAALIPGNLPDKFQDILIPVDFSVNSSMALEVASMIRTSKPSVELHGFHIYKVPQGYRKTGLDYDAFAEVMLDTKKEQMSSFLEEYSISQDSIHTHFQLNNGDSVPYLINKFALMNQMDLVIIGSRGSDTLSSLLLGSVTEGIIDRDLYLPMLVVKDKSENVKLWQALLDVR